MLEKRERTFSIYGPPDKVEIGWGIQVLDAGIATIPPGVSYPQKTHPEEYLFTWSKGRVLTEFQIVAICEGRGILETASAGALEVNAGDLFFLFPGEWHRYRPDPETGWKEIWLGFDGDYARRLMSLFALPSLPLQKGGATPLIQDVLLRIIAFRESVTYQTTPLLAAKVSELIARIVSQIRKNVPRKEQRDIHAIETAQKWILSHLKENITPEMLQLETGMSYSKFRKLFRQITGYAPHTFLMKARLNRAMNLLLQTDNSVSQIAYEAGFSSPFYFTRCFTRRLGMSPSVWRAQTGKRF